MTPRLARLVVAVALVALAAAGFVYLNGAGGDAQ